MTLSVVFALLCSCCWASFYFVLCIINVSRSYEWNCRLVTLVHGMVAICITAYIGYVDGPWPFTYPGTKNTPLQISALVVSSGYFIFDMAWCVYFRTEGPVMSAHHTMSISGIVSTSWSGESGIESCAVLFGSEVTNPLSQTRWFLKQTGRYETPLGDAVDVSFVSSFVVMRIFVGGTMLYCESISPRPRFFIKCGGVAMYASSWAFMVDIVRFAIRKSKSWHKQRVRQEMVVANGHDGKMD